MSQAIGTLRKSEAWAKWITRLRLRLVCNQREFADLCGISPAYVCRIEGHGWVPSFQTCVDIATKLNVDKWDLLRAAGYAPEGGV